MSTHQYYGTLFPAAVVGSLPRPDFVREAVMGERPMDAERLGQVMDAAVGLCGRIAGGGGIGRDHRWRMAARLVYRRDRRISAWL